MSSGGDHAPQDTTNPTIIVSAIDINLARDSRKTIESISIKLTKNNGSVEEVEKHISISAGRGHRENFVQSVDLDPNGHISVSVSCTWPSFARRRARDVVVDIDLRDAECMREDQGVKSFRKKVQKVEVVVTGGRRAHMLPGSTDSIIESCSRFRLLVIGNSGVGKSSLINKVFGVEGDLTSDNGRGIADIDREFVSPTNERFVIHDSPGFEAGDQQNMERVEDFVTRRKDRSQLTDQLHAVWLCLDIPHAGGRLLEGGVEMFLQRRKQILVPLVAILTKVDRLDTQLKLEPPGNEDVEQYRSRYLNEKCIRPLHRAAGNDIPCVNVSVQDSYSDSLPNLVTTTLQSMARHEVHEDSRAVAIIAQRVSIEEKIKLSITIGKKEYWETLLKGAVSRDHTMQEYLQVIRKDVSSVWNLYDPDQILTEDIIIKYLLRTDNLGKPSEELLHTDPFGDTIASALKLRMSKQEDASLPIGDVGISIGTYLGPKHDVKMLMAYIVDLICTMQTIFLLASDSHITVNTVALVLAAYEKPRIKVREEVNKFDGKQSHDFALNEVERLVLQYSIKDREIERLRKIIHES